MNNYELKVIPNIAADGNTYWTASYPAIPDCVGGGTTAEEAVKAAEENLDFYLECLKEEGLTPPQTYCSPQYSGKIALRIAKSTHEKLSFFAKSDDVSINSLINCAIENFLGIKKYELELDSKIQRIKDLTEQSISLQYANYKINEDLWNSFSENNIMVDMGVDE